MSDEPCEKACGTCPREHGPDGRHIDDVCPAWADGEHCYETFATAEAAHTTMIRRLNVKRCACGKVVSRTPTPEGQK